jgi:hypothetical protein
MSILRFSLIWERAGRTFQLQVILEKQMKDANQHILQDDSGSILYSDAGIGLLLLLESFMVMMC